MAKKAKESATVAENPGPLDPPLETIVYVGPDKAESPVFGSLSVGSRYQANVDFAAYLVATHPDHWQRPDA